MPTRLVSGLGEIEGLGFSQYPNVEQYRGIPYGIVPARFRQAKLVSSWPDGKLKATQYGPLSPYPKAIIGFSLVQKRLPVQHEYAMDEMKCLNLNITCPTGEVPESGYPVAVWVHGGGNVAGTGADPGYDMSRLCDFSVKSGRPTVFVTINYRLGIFGFLASDALKEDNKAAGDEGVGNYGVRDQILAFEWVAKNIKSFGGDPSRITAVGQSAGSIDIHMNMVSDIFSSRLPFHQAILQSGVCPLTVRDLHYQNNRFNKILEFFGIDTSLPYNKQIEILRGIDTDKLLTSYAALGSPVPSWQGTVDEYYLKILPKYSTIQSQQYHPSIKRVLLGDVGLEGSIFEGQIRKMEWTYAKVHALAVDTLGSDTASEVLGAYGISDNDSSDLVSSLVRLVSDAEWSQAIEGFAHGFSNGPLFYYHFELGNPFPGPNHRKAHHGVDLLFPFLTYQDHLPDALKGLALNMANHWLTFIHGGDPWTSYDRTSSEEAVVMLVNEDGKEVEIREVEKSSWKTLRLTETYQDKISYFALRLRGEDKNT
ncbi:uncharacterized protein BHQ10_009266 [Talaromyces amestolkiae]|uniref:Carboxylesterase type B domain-containing protein n=1 Tax=Talaromyces amestolkiae TaxID=1196081 RepID=A0A364LBR6_TALAM|nr:uncharacterized protein BHQ10_009266 [Talaromyces amestolkiae]RAO73254.1 hypothetical protein BHQ10_009266 [Talaromyces amestolkiae]